MVVAADRSRRSRRRVLGPVRCAAAAALAACATAPLDWQGRPDVGLDSYQRSFERAVGEQFDASATVDQLLGRLPGVRVLWLGDHHRDPQLHEQQRALLALLERRGLQLALGVEALGTADEPA